MCLSFCFPNGEQSKRAYSKVPNQRSTKSRDERPQTGAQAPGSRATTKEAPTGRQRPKHVVIKHVIYSVAPSGLSFVNALVPGVDTPVCGLSRLRRFSPDTNNNKEEAPSKGGVSHSTEHRLTLHGGKAHAPRSIGLHSTERETPPLRMCFEHPWISAPT